MKLRSLSTDAGPWRWQALGLLMLGLLLGVPPAAGQQGPIRLFPDLAPAPDAEPPPAAQIPESARPPEAPATDAPPSGFRVEGLAAPAIDAIGVLGPGAPEFDQNLWRGSDGALIVELISALPVTTYNPPLRALTRRLLATGAPLEGASETGRLLELRVERLRAMGDLTTAKALVDQLPPSPADSALARLAVEIDLLSGDLERACQRTGDIAPTSSASFWAKAMVVCRLADGDEDEARLGIELLREAGQTDDAVFFALAEALASGTGAAALDLTEPSALHVGLLRLAEQPLSDAALRSAAPAVLAAAARDPALAGERRLEVTERAFVLGSVDRATLTAAYADHDPEGAADSLAMIESDWGPEARALAYRAAIEGSVPAAQAELLAAVWQAAAGPERFLVAEAFAEPFRALAIESSLAWLAPAAARALLAADRPVPAARWFSLLTGQPAGDAQAAQDAARLAPLFALAGLGDREAVPALDGPSLEALRSNVAEAETERLLGLLEGVGARLTPAAWEDVLAPPFVREAALPKAGLWRGLERASAERRVGETVLHALLMLDGRPEAAHPEVLIRTLGALRGVGLDLEARAIAVAAAIGEGW